MKLVRYKDGAVTVNDEPKPELPPGGLLVQTEACGLCSGELMAWYMDQKADPVLGHEVAGKVVESDAAAFPVGARVFPHHHAPCMVCDRCKRGAYVQCETWRRTKLIPGGMADFCAVPKENLTDTHIVDDLRAIDAALAEPLACVVKSLRQARWRNVSGAIRRSQNAHLPRPAVIGLGNMGLLHMLALGPGAVGYELNVERRAWATSLNLDARAPGESEEFDTVFVCPGTPAALELALTLVAPRGTILLFAPFGSAAIPAGTLDQLYFKDVALATSYSAGPDDVKEALGLLRAGNIRAEHIVSNFIGIDAIAANYNAMRKGEILKAMVVFELSRK